MFYLSGINAMLKNIFLSRSQQIEGIKNDYNFGIEVEMNHITRKNAARIAAECENTELRI